MTRRRVALVLIAACALMGCSFELPPVTSAAMASYSSGQPGAEVQLSPPRVRALASWFAQHPAGWSPSYVSYAPMLVVRLLHADGDTSVVNVLSTKLVVFNRRGQVEQSFSASELSSLRAVLGIESEK